MAVFIEEMTEVVLDTLKDRLSPEVIAEAARRAQAVEAARVEGGQEAAPTDGQAPTGPAPEGGEGQSGKDAAPWEKRGEEYDADKAATLIRNLRDERNELREALRRSKGEVDALLRNAGSGASDAQRLATVEAEVAQLRAQNAEYRRANALTRAGISEEFSDLITGTTDEEISGQVQRLVALAATLTPGGFEEPAHHNTDSSMGGDTNALWKRGLGF